MPLLPTPIQRAAMAVLLSAGLTGCLSVGMPQGGYPGSGAGSGYPDTRGQSVMQGSVYDVDHRNRRFMITADGGYASGGGYQRPVEFHYDGNTTLLYRGQRLAPDGLEPGDGVRIAYADDGRRLWARQIDVTHDVRGGGGYSGQTPYPSSGSALPGDLRGTVTAVEPHNRVVRVRDGNGPEQWMRYDDTTVVEYQGQRYHPDQLERGDLIRVQAQRQGDVWTARSIVVERSVRGN